MTDIIMDSSIIAIDQLPLPIPTNNSTNTDNNSIINNTTNNGNTAIQPLSVIEREPESAYCGVCGDGEGTEDNPLVYCDSCDLAVHVECYGFPLTIAIPADEWHCARCEWEKSTNISNNHSKSTISIPPQCALCPVKIGALKRTTDWQWCHLSCAQWIPEVYFRIPDGREPIDILSIQSHKYNQCCEYCKLTIGVCTICSEPNCNRWFHITCGNSLTIDPIYLEYKSNRDGTDVIVSYCSKHAQKWRKGKKGSKASIKAS